jgi:hypothetical protein
MACYGDSFTFYFVPFLQEVKCSAGGPIAAPCSRNREHGGRTVQTDIGISFTTRGTTAQAQSGGGSRIVQRPWKKTI